MKSEEEVYAKLKMYLKARGEATEQKHKDNLENIISCLRWVLK